MAKLERTEKPINGIIEERYRGELGLPEIQRGYVRGTVLKLLEEVSLSIVLRDRSCFGLRTVPNKPRP
ncbi:MAG: hypothetical protein N2Z79_03200 [Candidatus Omnitrophica bacterium]|nr:hypothetical protein [Candidatus Omnitrophota bacterium]